MKRGRNWFWGIFLLVAGILVVVAQVTSFASIGFWSILAAVMLVAAFIQSLVRLSWPPAMLSLALLYIIFQKPLSLFYIQPWLLLLAALLVGIGLSVIIRKPGHRHHYGGAYHLPPAGGKGPEGEMPADGEYPRNGGFRPAMEADGNSDDNHPYLSVSFGATSRYLHSTALEDGHFQVSFGAAEIYLDQAVVSPNGATLNLDVSFGSLKLYVPGNWNVRDNITTSLGGVDNDMRRARPDPSLPPVNLVGSASFGSVEITYI